MKKLILDQRSFSKARLLFSFLFFTFNFSFSQAPLVKQWDKRFGGIYYETFYCFQQTRDGGYILGGSAQSGISGDKTQPNQDTSYNTYDYWVVKIDSLGNKQWDKTFGGTANEYMAAIKQTADGGYILGGSSASNAGGDKTQASSGGYDYWIVKINSLGNKQWDKTFGGPLDDFLSSIQITNTGGYILGGYSNSGIGGEKSQPKRGAQDYWVVKTDVNGNKIWDKDYAGPDSNTLTSLEETNDGGYILGGYSFSDSGVDKTQNTQGYADYWLVKIDSGGIKQWDKDFGTAGNDMLISAKQTKDGGYILGGFAGSGVGGDKTQPTQGSIDYWIIKTDALGNKLWDKDFGGTALDELDNILQTTDGGYLMAGKSLSNKGGDKTEDNLGQQQTWVVKADSLGNKVWDKTIFTYPGLNNADVGYVMQTNDNGIAVANYTQSDTGGYKTEPNWDTSLASADYWIVKFRDTTHIINISTQIVAVTVPNSAISLYPNPANNELTIEVLNAEAPKQITITNDLGQTLIQLSTYKTKTQIDIHALAAGIYFVKTQLADGSVQVNKLVKE